MKRYKKTRGTNIILYETTRQVFDGHPSAHLTAWKTPGRLRRGPSWMEFFRQHLRHWVPLYRHPNVSFAHLDLGFILRYDRFEFFLILLLNFHSLCLQILTKIHNQVITTSHISTIISRQISLERIWILINIPIYLTSFV